LRLYTQKVYRKTLQPLMKHETSNKPTDQLSHVHSFKSRQRERVVFEMVRESVPTSKQTGRRIMTERASSVCRQSDSRDVQLATLNK